MDEEDWMPSDYSPYVYEPSYADFGGYDQILNPDQWDFGSMFGGDSFNVDTYDFGSLFSPEPTDMTGFYQDPFEASGTDLSFSDNLPVELQGTDYSRLLGLGSTGGMDAQNLFGIDDYLGQKTQDTAGLGIEGVNLMELANQGPLAQSRDPSLGFNSMIPDYGQSMPSSSYINEAGQVVGTGSGADVENPYRYLTGPTGDTYIVDVPASKPVGYVDNDLNRVLYGDIALQNGVPMSIAGASTNAPNSQYSPVGSSIPGQPKSPGSGSGAGGASSGGKTATEPKKTPLQQGLANAALVAQLLGLLGKNAKPPEGKGTNRGATPMNWSKAIAQPRQNLAVGGPVRNGNKPTSIGALGLLRGDQPGQADKVPVAASHGEYVVDADVVAALGDGNTEAGAAKLDGMRKEIRQHKRSAPTDKIPPKAKSPLQYMKGMKNGR